MNHRLTLEIPDKVYCALQQEATSTGKSLEQVTLERVTQQPAAPERGTVDALMRFYGAWQMEPANEPASSA